MNKKEILDILDNAKDESGAVPMRLVRQAFDKLPTVQSEKTQLSQEGKESLCKKVRALCEESKIEFFFVGGGESTWSVTNDKHIKKIVECHKAQLSQEGTTKDATSDTISRQAAINAVNNAFDRETLLTGFVRSIAVRAIRDMPSAQPEERTKKRTETHGVCLDATSRQEVIDAAKHAWAKGRVEIIPPARTGNGMTDLYVRDRQTGEIHRIGDDHHDQLTYNERGQICYHNLQNGDGCRTGESGLRAGYEFVMNEDDHGYNMDPREQEDGGLT